MFTVTLVGTEELRARLDVMPAKIHQKLLIAITGLAFQIENYVKTQKLEGQVLNHITGKLQSSIHSGVQDNKDSIIGRVYSSGINYAAIHEYGGQIPDRYPVNAKALHFFAGGNEVFAKFARGFTMPERSYLRSSLAENRDKIIQTMKKAVTDSMVKS